ncbi:hypothetical protein VIGAN_10218200 [Vigna angularis var. angularis]|uniref:Uncharacterized protein n=1 Tax=Vigna angularis var. angularis TaxID=157739 RepID=A0A0S3T5X8_PHAAN|nr:hypothetical protein VIGAN_10218200 [Vigna angularis var. angularis]
MGFIGRSTTLCFHFFVTTVRYFICKPFGRIYVRSTLNLKPYVWTYGFVRSFFVIVRLYSRTFVLECSLCLVKTVLNYY